MQDTKDVIVLRALHAGIPLSFEWVDLELRNGLLVTPAFKYLAGELQETKEKIFLPFDIDMNFFIECCENLPNSEIDRLKMELNKKV